MYKVVSSGYHPVAVMAPPEMPAPTAARASLCGAGVLVWLMAEGVFERMRGDDGRGSGVERGDGVLREPRAKKANLTLTVIIAILIVLLYRHLAWIAKHYGVTAMVPDAAGLPEPAEICW